MKLEFKIALHHLEKGKSKGTWITLFGVSVGVMALIVVISAINGFERELEHHMIGHEAHVILYRKDQGIKDWQSLIKKIQNVDSDIQSVLPITYDEVLWISKKDKVSGSILEGVDPNSAFVIEALKDKKFEPNGCYLGEELAKKLAVQSGEKIQALLFKSKGEPKLVQFTVLGTFSSGLYEYSSRYVYARLEDTQQKLGWGKNVSAFKIQLKHPQNAKQLSRKIRAQVSFPFFIRTWFDVNRNIFIALKMEKIVIGIILCAIILVALFNVVSSLIMIVLEKTKEISILKSLGMTQRQISSIFVLQGMMVTFVGTSVGIILAWGLCKLLEVTRLIQLSPEIYYLSYLPVEMRWHEVGVIFIFLMGMSAVVSFYPASKAAEVTPAEGLRYE